MKFLQQHNKAIYVAILAIAGLCLLASYIPGGKMLFQWVTPPMMLFLGLAHALLCGQAFPAFNRKVSKSFLQYSVVGLGFGMNLHASLSTDVLRSVGLKPFVQGLLLWIIISIGSLLYILW